MQVNSITRLVINTLIIAVCAIPATGQVKTDSAAIFQKDIQSKFQTTPSDWLRQTENTLIQIEGKLLSGYDTSFMMEDFDRLEKDYLLALNDFDIHGQFMRIRTLEDLIAKLNQQHQKVVDWSKRIYKINRELTSEFFLLENIKSDSIQQHMRQDTVLWNIYGNEARDVGNWLTRIDTQY